MIAKSIYGMLLDCIINIQKHMKLLFFQNCYHFFEKMLTKYEIIYIMKIEDKTKF